MSADVKFERGVGWMVYEHDTEEPIERDFLFEDDAEEFEKEYADDV